MGQSRLEDILEAQLLELEYNQTPLSRWEAIEYAFMTTGIYTGAVLSRIEYFLTGGKDIEPLSEIERIIRYREGYDGPITTKCSNLLMKIIELNYKHDAILDNFSNPLLDSDGGIIYGRIFQ